MGIFDKAKDALSEHSELLDQGIDKGGDLIDEKTGGKYVGQVDKGQEFAKDQVRGPENEPAEPPA